MSFRRFMIAVALLWLGMLALYLTKRPLPVQQPGLVEQLQRMPPETTEVSRHYWYIDSKDRRMAVTFQDGSFGLREKDEDGRITWLTERKKDGTTVVYELSDKAELKSIATYRKNGKMFSLHIALGEKSYKRVFFADDGQTPLGILDIAENWQTITLFDAKGAKRYLQMAETNAAESEYYWDEGGETESSLYYEVYGGSPKPLYRQYITQKMSYEYGAEPQLELDSVVVFEAGTSIVSRRITPGASVTVGNTTRTLTQVEVLSNGEVRFVRYLDESNRIVRMVDKTKSPEEVTDVSEADATVEEIDPQWLTFPETAADQKLARQMVANAELNLQRLLVP